MLRDETTCLYHPELHGLVGEVLRNLPWKVFKPLVLCASRSSSGSVYSLHQPTHVPVGAAATPSPGSHTNPWVLHPSQLVRPRPGSHMPWQMLPGTWDRTITPYLSYTHPVFTYAIGHCSLTQPGLPPTPSPTSHSFLVHLQVWQTIRSNPYKFLLCLFPFLTLTST